MTKVLSFSKLRFIAPIFSVSLIVIGILVMFLGTGINLGIDFDAGVNVRLQIAPVAFSVSYSGDATTELNIKGQVLTLEVTGQDETANYTFPFSEYTTLDTLAQALGSVDGFSVNVAAAGTTETTMLLTLNYPYAVGVEPVLINQSVTESAVDAETVRGALASFGAVQIQMIGASENQEFQVRVPEEPDSRDFDQEVSRRLKSLIEAEYGNGTVLIRQTDYVGARLSQNLAQQTVYLSVLALVLILIYIWFRFKLAYAVSAIAALLHDTLFMFAFVAVSGMEFSTATIAAILTIIGYSLNDTIVIFDRIRENTGLMRGTSIREIADTSISQSLSRTLMTSLTTLLAVIALYIFGTGTIKDFALAVIFGVLVGTYSSLFIASPMLMGWITATGKRKRAKDAEHYGSKVAETNPNEPEDTPESKTTERGPAVIPVIERRLKGKRKNK
jgi:preprotein translocase subunit SecF